MTKYMEKIPHHVTATAVKAWRKRGRYLILRDQVMIVEASAYRPYFFFYVGNLLQNPSPIALSVRLYVSLSLSLNIDG